MVPDLIMAGAITMAGVIIMAGTTVPLLPAGGMVVEGAEVAGMVDLPPVVEAVVVRPAAAVGLPLVAAADLLPVEVAAAAIIDFFIGLKQLHTTERVSS